MLPISLATNIITAHAQKQVIIFAWDGENTHVVTDGADIIHADLAAKGANEIKKTWKWPDELMGTSQRVQDSIAENERLKEKIIHLLAGENA